MQAARYDAVFASDVHLCADQPATADAFLRFIDADVAGRTGRFFILGDLFEYWTGDEDLDDPLTRRVAMRLRRLADEGVETSFIAGNRDFLIGDAFADAARLRLLPDPFEMKFGDVDLLLSHGDALCIDDVDYQRFRSMVRDPAWQRDFLARPFEDRRAMVAGARMQSESAKRGKSMTIMDVNEGAVAALIGERARTLIHGHTHRPAHHVHRAMDRSFDRWVLPDWDAEAKPPRGGGLALAGGTIVELPLIG